MIATRHLVIHTDQEQGEFRMVHLTFISLQDDDPYVRKTAAVCVAKLFDINPELVEDRGFLDMLKVRLQPQQDCPED